MKEYVLTLLVTAAVTYLLTPLVRRLAVKVGAVPPVRERDVHQVPIPRMGGLAMFGGVAAGLLVASQLSPLRGVFTGTNLLSGLLQASALIVAVGIIDDRWGMSAIGKLAGQVAAGAILAYSGAQLDTFPLPKGGALSLTPNESVALTILVVVATINAVNFIDGLDGLAAGIVCLAAVSFFSYYYALTKVVHLSAEGVPALASVVLAGACLGFLPHNFFPAKIIMGDTGAMLLGLLLAYVPISALSSLPFASLTESGTATVNRFPTILPLLLPAAALIVPYTDMLRAVVRRTRAGRPVFSADRKHLHHRLLDIGHSHRRSVLILYLWAALFSGTVVGLSLVRTQLVFFAVVTVAAMLALLLMSMPRLRWWTRNRPVLAVTGSAVPGAGAGPGEPVAATAVPALATSPAGPGSAGPPGNGAARNGLVRGAPVSSGPLGSQSASSGLVRGAPVSDAPLGSEPARNGLVRGAPVSGGPLGSESVSSGPLGNGPLANGVASTEPVSSRPASTEPVSSGPVSSGNCQAGAGSGEASAGRSDRNGDAVPDGGRAGRPGPPWALSQSATWREGSGP